MTPRRFWRTCPGEIKLPRRSKGRGILSASCFLKLRTILWHQIFVANSLCLDVSSGSAIERWIWKTALFKLVGRLLPTHLGTNILSVFWVDDFPFPKVGYGFVLLEGKSSRNSGRDPYPTFWRRSPLRKNPVLLAGLFRNRNWFLAYQKREIQKHACYLASICNLFFFENQFFFKVQRCQHFFLPSKIYIDVSYLQLFWTSFMELYRISLRSTPLPVTVTFFRFPP